MEAFAADVPSAKGGGREKRMKNYKMVICYEGTRYDGWQKQTATDQTVQGKLEAVLSRMCGAPVEVQGSGRTDAGVHALAQVANAHMETELSAEQIRDYMNLYLPADISVEQVEPASDRFHSRLNARRKTYCYRIYTGETKPVFERNYVWTVKEPLSVARMQAAADFLLGEHDFKSFCANKRMKKSTVRRIDSLTVRRQGKEIRIAITGNGFLYNMVRIITGTLWEVGSGQREPEEMAKILAKRDRQAAGITAPAQGLTLMEVFY